MCLCEKYNQINAKQTVRRVRNNPPKANLVWTRERKLMNCLGFDFAGKTRSLWRTAVLQPVQLCVLSICFICLLIRLLTDFHSICHNAWLNMLPQSCHCILTNLMRHEHMQSWLTASYDNFNRIIHGSRGRLTNLKFWRYSTAISNKTAVSKVTSNAALFLFCFLGNRTWITICFWRGAKKRGFFLFVIGNV